MQFPQTQVQVPNDAAFNILAASFARAHNHRQCCRWSPGIHGMSWIHTHKPDAFTHYMENYLSLHYSSTT